MKKSKAVKQPPPDRRCDNGRDHDPKTGRFVRGNSGGPGRAPRQKERDLLKLLAATCTPEEMSLVYQRALVDAQNGDAQARAWLAKYLLPTVPAQLSVSQTVLQAGVGQPGKWSREKMIAKIAEWDALAPEKKYAAKSLEGGESTGWTMVEMTMLMDELSGGELGPAPDEDRFFVDMTDEEIGIRCQASSRNIGETPQIDGDEDGVE